MQLRQNEANTVEFDVDVHVTSYIKDFFRISTLQCYGTVCAGPCVPPVTVSECGVSVSGERQGSWLF